ncbi:MAG: hypothetical protein PVI23_09995 [Maricaulaceae bacterium]|jgi:hypothetical protein
MIEPTDLTHLQKELNERARAAQVARDLQQFQAVMREKTQLHRQALGLE